MVAQFDIVDNETVYGSFIPFEEEDEEVLRVQFVETGYESSYAMVNMGTNVIIITVLIFFKLLLLIFLPCRR